MKRSGNCGDGIEREIDEPREGFLHEDRVEEIAWHQGRTASATGYEATKHRRAKAIHLYSFESGEER